MKNGIPEFEKDAETLMAAYRKFNIYGMTKEPLTPEEMVLIFCIAKWMRKMGGKWGLEYCNYESEGIGDDYYDE